MPRSRKRKRSEDVDFLLAKIKELEKKINRKRPRILDISSSSSSSRDSSPHNLQDDNMIEDSMNSQQELVNQYMSSEAPARNEPIDSVTNCVANSSSDALTNNVTKSSAHVCSNTVTNASEPQPGPSNARDDLTQTILNAATDEEEFPELSDEVLEILGVDPTASIKFGKDIQKDLAIRFEHLVCNGLSKELRKELKERYLIPANCQLIDAPTMNPEIKAALSEIMNKKLKSIEAKQKQTGNVIACLGEAITHILTHKEKDSSLLKILMDASRMLCDVQHSNSLTRRTFILASLKKEMKDQLIATKIDKFLFGKDLGDTLKSAKAINKQGAELKANQITNATAKNTNFKPNKPFNQHLNWKRAPSTAATRSSKKTPRTQTQEPVRQRTPRESSSRGSRQTTSRTRH